MKTCSVIVPIYNAAPYLAQCLSSLRMQTYSDLQIILINDGSTDASATIAQSFVEADPRFVLIEQSNKGQGTARNVGMQQAKGEYIVFVDADDYLDSDWVERHITALGDANYVKSGYRRVQDGAVLESKKPRHRYQFTSPCMRLYRACFMQDLFFPEHMIYEDVIFSLLIWAKHPEVIMLPYEGYNYTYNPASTTTTPHPEAQRRLFTVIWELDVPHWLKCYTFLRLRAHFRK